MVLNDSERRIIENQLRQIKQQQAEIERLREELMVEESLADTREEYATRYERQRDEAREEIERLRAKVKRRDDKVADLLRDIKLWHGIKADRDERITERDEAREVARRFYEDIYDPTGSEVKRYPWLEEK